MPRFFHNGLLTTVGGLLGIAMLLNQVALPARAEEPPAINPFAAAPSQRDDALPGYVELSDGTIHLGQIYLTRDKRLQIYDAKLQRQREVPLQAVKQIQCTVKREWLEKEWKFKEATSDEKLYTGRSYPAREYLHTITLQDGRTIEGDLSGIVYVQPPSDTSTAARTQPLAEPQRFLLHQRDKGDVGTDLKSLVYVKLVRLGEEALKEAEQKAARHLPRPAKSGKATGGPPS